MNITSITRITLKKIHEITENRNSKNRPHIIDMSRQVVSNGKYTVCEYQTFLSV